jgi:hypothetical protein
MTGHESHIGYLKGLTPPERDRELKQALTDSLQELVASVERALPLAGNTLHSCVIDDFQLQAPALDERECRVPLRFSASTRQGSAGSTRLEQIAGQAQAVIDDQGRVTFQDVRFTEDQAFVPHDVGGGD